MTHENAENNTNATILPASEKETPNQEIPLEPIADILARAKEATPHEENLKEQEQKEPQKPLYVELSHQCDKLSTDGRER